MAVRFAAALALSLLAGVGMAAEPEQCLQYRVYQSWNAQYATGSSATGACGAFGAAYVASYTGPHTWTLTSTSVDGSSCVVNYSVYNPSTGNTGNFAAGGTISTTMIDCPPNPCDVLSGLPGMTDYTGTPPGQMCTQNIDYPGTSCEVVKKGAGIAVGANSWFGQVEFTGESCEEPNVGDNPPNCVSGPSGQACIDKTKQSCGTVNGEAVCLTDVPPGNCMLLAGGGAICAEDAEQPKDEMDEDLEPDLVIEGNDGEGNTTNYNYYSESSVTSSSTSVTGVGNPSGGTSTGNSEAEPEEEPACEGVEECVGGLGALDGIEGSTAAFMSRIEGAPLVVAVSNIGGSIPEGECPAPSFEAFGQELTLSAMCEIVDPVMPIIAAVMLFVWAVFGVRVVMSA